jgi:hypothetical protein
MDLSNASACMFIIDITTYGSVFTSYIVMAFKRYCKNYNSVVVIKHHTDVIKFNIYPFPSCEYLIRQSKYMYMYLTVKVSTCCLYTIYVCNVHCKFL